jgi:endonuclease/exonuclease/phosphatase family metal-dependent hydrolase
VLRKANPVSLLIVLVLHIFVAVRMAALVAVESVLAAVDAFRGIIERRDLLRELRFAPKRVALCVLLREMVALGARVDAARGLRVVACNFVGYDEQSHHRGPDSLFAHWTLKGIDKAIRGIFRAAERSASRDYDVWLYSDHGQEPSVAFEDETGRTVHETVSRVFERHGVQREPTTVERPTVQLQRVILLGGRVLQKLLGWPGESLFSPVKVGAMGPVAHAYTPEELPDYRKADVAQDLVMTEDVAAVAGALRDGSVMLWTDEGSFRLPDQAEVLVGRDHPFREELPDDLVRLAHHPDAGSLVLFGWRAGQPCVTFGTENGAHAGPAERETHAFALVPRDTRISVRGDAYVRPLDIRGAALHLLGRGPAPAPTPPAVPRHPRHVRVMTYNVHSCVGLDGKHSPERVARVIARYAPDVVALQELDVNRLRTGGVHQARRIARALEMDYHFHPSFVVEEEQYGNAVLSRLPMRVVKTGPLPGGGRLEPRGVLWVEVDFDGMAVQLLNTHFGLRPTERLRQVQTLIGQDWLGSEQCIGPLVVCGDLNSQPGSRVYVRLCRMLQDAQEACDGGAHVPTWMQLRRVDHIFSSPGMTVVDAVVPRTRLTRVTSDHYPVIADLEFSESALRPD